MWLCTAIVVSLAIDIVRGAPLMSSSMAGYSFVEGARYYGIGNELMGTMLGATLVGGGSASHMGRVADLAAGGDALGVLTILQRKVALNFMLLSTSLWSRLLALSLASSAALFCWGRHRFGKELLTREESAAAVGCCVGVAGTFAFDDSGVVTAAGCSVFLWALLALRTMSHARTRKQPES